MWRSQTSCTLFYNFTLRFSNFAQFYLVYKNLVLLISTILLVNDSLFSLSRSCSVKILLLPVVLPQVIYNHAQASYKKRQHHIATIGLITYPVIPLPEKLQHP